MTKYQIAADTIKNSISALDVGNMLGLDIRRGRCKCPAHGGTDYNCVLYPNKRGWYCHVCHAYGDCIGLVQEAAFGGREKGTFKQAIEWINSAFRLGLDLEGKIDQEKARRAEIALQRRKEAQELEEWKDRMWFDLWLAVDQVLEILEVRREMFRPKTANEPWSDEFCEAVRLIPKARMLVEYCLMNCIKEKET